MALSIVQSHIFAAASSGSYSYSAGNLLVLMWSNGGSATVTGVSDTAGNSWTALTQYTNGVLCGQCWYAKNIKSSPSNVVTVALSGSGGTMSGTIYEVAGADKSAPADVDNGPGIFISGPPSYLENASGFSTALANEILFAMARSNAVSTFTAPAGFTQDDSGTGLTADFAHQIVSTTQSYLAGAFQYPVSPGGSSNLMVIASFKQATTPPASGVVNSLIMLGCGT